MAILNDDKIESLLRERKILPKNYSKRIKTKPKSGYRYEERELEVSGEDGNTFLIVLRKNTLDVLDFSIILRYREVHTGKCFNIARYNGKHKHTNHLEKETLHDFHSHIATGRYQEAGLKIEGYATVNTTYQTFTQAIHSFLKDLNFIVEPPDFTRQLEQFGGI